MKSNVKGTKATADIARAPLLISVGILLIAILAISPANANTTITFSDLNLNPQTIVVYTFDGSKVGEYNSTATVDLPGDITAYNFVFKPTTTDLMKNPTTFVEWLYSLLPLIFAFIVCACLAVAVGVIVVRALGAK
jgi:hypothetical protein